MDKQPHDLFDRHILKEKLQNRYHKRTIHSLMSIIEHQLSSQETQSLDLRQILKQFRDLSIREMTNQELQDRYTGKMLKLKTLLTFGRRSDRFLGYPNTAMMNRYKWELERRGLPIPQVSLPEEQA